MEAIKKKYPILDESGNPSTFPNFGSQVFGDDEDKRALWQDGKGFYADDSAKLGNLTADQVAGKAIHESGDGYIQYIDGTQMCWGTTMVEVIGYGQYGNLYYFVIGNVMTLPKDFSNDPLFIVSPVINTNLYTVSVDMYRDSSGNINVIGVSATNTNGTHAFRWLAVGRWK